MNNECPHYLIDAGNTRIKLCPLDNFFDVTSFDHEDAFVGHLSELSALFGVRHFTIASVRGERFRRMVDQHVIAQGCVVSWLETRAVELGVRCGYPNPAHLGVDRWMAILGAVETFAPPLVVVDAGSAVTVDLVDRDLRHLGGYIVPGFAMQRRALFSNTGQIASFSADGSGDIELSLAIDTAEAVNNGIYAMLVGLIERALASLDVPETSLVLGGGDAALLGRHFSAANRSDCMVFQGMARLAKERGLEEVQ